VAEYDDRHIYRTQYGQFMRFLEEATFALEKGPCDGQREDEKFKRFGHTYTDRFRSSLIALISIFLRPMLGFGAHVTSERVGGTDFGGVMDLRPTFLACVSLRWGGRGTKSTKAALASKTLLEGSVLKGRRLFRWRHGAGLRRDRVLELYVEKLISFQRGFERKDKNRMKRAATGAQFICRPWRLQTSGPWEEALSQWGGGWGA
jgi:hypothetical protein